MTRNDPTRVPRLCPVCMTALGYWTDPQGLCPRCALVAKGRGGRKSGEDPAASPPDEELSAVAHHVGSATGVDR